jgi:hypothetical protein
MKNLLLLFIVLATFTLGYKVALINNIPIEDIAEMKIDNNGYYEIKIKDVEYPKYNRIMEEVKR